MSVVGDGHDVTELGELGGYDSVDDLGAVGEVAGD